ncbi:Hydroxymethylglutaryl-CoA lyase YngG [Usitatibacter rugosus]|uniref:Hydroxymethylglutaryl-CoA lyase YngG n=1 Tax=Usitatibacter rugosus TaxID=2732067 RepID=A0A6M4GQA9_9PROT|nr:hydroxymethylglutaryl-CoA lyase [Usitatibacter rugosus]QJR09529.1 Hydroxymethylglutaryl-CoA lyase YngG [Usitatibacter rugosus]
MHLPEKMLLVDVAPRDGLQSLPKWIDTDTKVWFSNRLSELGVPVVEVASFAHPKVVPNMKDAEDVFAKITRKPGTVYRGQAPNVRGAHRAIEAKVGEMLGLITVSETYTQHNQNMTNEECVAQNIQMFRLAEQNNIPFVAAIGMAFWCPYEGLIPEEDVEKIVGEFFNAGIKRQYLAGSLGMEDPAHVNRLYKRLYAKFPGIELGFHIHNMSGMATANILAAMDAGVHWMEGAICGIGGGMAIPSSAGSCGNFPLEDLVTMLEESGVKTGMNPIKVQEAAHEIAAKLGIPVQSHRGAGNTREIIMKKGRENPNDPQVKG